MTVGLKLWKGSRYQRAAAQDCKSARHPQQADKGIIGIVAKSESESDRVRRVRHPVESLQMASLSWRCHSLVRAVVPEVSDLLCAHGRDGARTWSAHPLQLYLALGPSLRAGTGQALSRSPETYQQKLPR